MSETRSPDELVDAVVALQARLDTLETLVAVRASTRPTGDIEPTVRVNAKTGTLLLQGQTVNRADYPVLWQFAQDESLVISGLFTIGDGTLTFGLPDFRGRVIVGASPLAVGAKVGADSIVLVAGNMPVHDHTYTAAFHHVDHGHGSHGHGDSGVTNSIGQHGGHFPGTQFNAQLGPDYGLAAWNSGGTFNGQHQHTVDTGWASTIPNGVIGTHTLDINSAGNVSPTSLDNRQASLALNWLIYV